MVSAAAKREPAARQASTAKDLKGIEGSCETTCIYAREWPNIEGQKGCFQGFLSGKRKLFSLYAKNSKFFVLEKGKRAFRWKLGGGGRDGES
jgi:hypothetical protein